MLPLVVWILAGLAFQYGLMFSAVRYVLFLAPPIILLVLRNSCWVPREGWLTAMLGANLLFVIALGFVDVRQASVYPSVVTEEIFPRPPDYTLSDFLTENCFNGIHGEPMAVRLRAFGVTARVFAERTFHPSQREIYKTTDRMGNVETIIVEMRVARGRGLERFITSWLPEVEVLEPMELRQKISTILGQSLRQNGERE